MQILGYEKGVIKGEGGGGYEKKELWKEEVWEGGINVT